jgi:RimJ/RimL family protein N-acetyltransferase
MIRGGFDRLAQALEETDAIAHTHTDRLCLRRPTPADAEAVAQIQGDPATNAFNPSGPAGAGKAATMLEVWIADWDRDGIGYWMVTPACGEPVIGVAGVRRAEDVDADHVTPDGTTMHAGGERLRFARRLGS